MSDPVGSVAEEAAKLLGALQDWAAEGAAGGLGATARDAGASAAGGLGAAARAFGEHVDQHLATGDDCTYCPLCRVIRSFRHTSPEVRAHLGVAATSLLQAVTAALETHVPERSRADGVEKIDLDDDGWPSDTVD